MHELLPETWWLDETQDSCCRSSRPKRGLLTDIGEWTECYASLVTVHSTKFPEMGPQFMCYLCTIVRASRNFEGAAWASYDAAFRRHATNRGSLDWAAIDLTIYNKAFTGRAKLLPRCRYCLSKTHKTRDYQFAPREELPPLKQFCSATWGRPASERQTTGRSIEVCELWQQVHFQVVLLCTHLQ